MVQPVRLSRTPPVRLMLPDPAVAVMVPDPQKVAKFNPLGVATTRPAGSVSVKARPFSTPLGFGLRTSKVRVVVPPTDTLAAPKDLLIVGGPSTSRLAF